MEAYCGAVGYEYAIKWRSLMKETANYLHARPDEVMERLEKQSEDTKELQKKLKAIQGGQVKELAKGLTAKAETIGCLKVVVANWTEKDRRLCATS